MTKEKTDGAERVVHPSFMEPGHRLIEATKEISAIAHGLPDKDLPSVIVLTNIVRPENGTLFSCQLGSIETMGELLVAAASLNPVFKDTLILIGMFLMEQELRDNPASALAAMGVPKSKTKRAPRKTSTKKTDGNDSN